jgi:hypothetical protein
MEINANFIKKMQISLFSDAKISIDDNRPMPNDMRRMRKPLHISLLWIALFFSAQLLHASHVHADGLPLHTDCITCQLSANQPLHIPNSGLTLANTTHHAVFSFVTPKAPAPLRVVARNRGPPFFA